MKAIYKQPLVAAIVGTLAWIGAARAQEGAHTDVGTLDKATAEKAFPKPPYSPYAGRNFPTRPFFGDTHLHTSFSFDAGAFGCPAGPEGRLSLRQGRGGHGVQRPAA